MMKTIRKTAIVMLLFVYFLTYGVLPQVLAAGKDTPMIVVAHRAGAKVAPENTLAALEQAIRDGAPIAEIDVQQLSDGTLIVMHDSNFKRTAGEDVCVWDTEADVLSTLEVGSTFSAAYRGEQIPTLEEMLACAGDRITLMIELKYSGQEQELEDQRAEADTLLGDMMKAYEEMNADYEQNMANEAELSDEIAKSEAAYYAALSKEEAERIAALNRQNNNKGSNSNSSGATNTGGWLYPLPYQCQVTDSYGYRTHPLTGKYSWHNGVDFGAAAGTAILATKSGTVTTAAYSAAWGYYVVINHGDGYSSLYAHQPSCSVSVGDYVTQGQTIGYVGSTGWSTGPHLHFTIYYNGADVNPFNYIG